MSYRISFAFALLLLAACANSQPVGVAPVAVEPEPTDAPVIPTDAPLEPTDAPLEPTSPPVAPPTAPPVDPPTAAPVDPPTDAPVPDPTESPVAPPTDAPVPPPTDAPVVPPTDAPVPPPTDAPVVPPTDAPVPDPTSAPVVPPTDAPVPDPTSAPVVPPTPVPTTTAPVTAMPTTGAPITPGPTDAPITPQPTSGAPVTTAPSVTASGAPSAALPSAVPSPMPSPMGSFPPTAVISVAPSGVETEKPSGGPSIMATLLPSSSPSLGPTTLVPSQGPSADGTTEQPTVERSTPEPFAGLSMTFSGMSPLSSESIALWQSTTSEHVRAFYESDTTVGVVDVASRFTITNQDPPAGRRLLRRGLQQQVTLTYTEDIAYRAVNPNVEAKQVIEEPFIRASFRQQYVALLMETDDPAFASINSVSNVRFPPEDTGGSGGLGTGAIIGIVVGSAAGFLLLLGGAYYMRNRSQQRKGYFSGVGETPPTSIKAGADEVSTLAEPAKSGGQSLAGYGDQPSVTTVDYDYSKAYGGGADHSVSSAGGTFGSNPQALGANQGAVAAGGAATLGSYSDDGSFGDGAGAPNVREELLDIFAPAGKLGVVIDTPDDGAPVVHAIKDSSVIADKLQVGDKLVAVDDEDVRTMTAIKVSKLISRKSGNPSRKLSIIRSTLVE